MDNYRDALKSHFVGNPKYASIMNLEYAWWGGGLALLLIGGLISLFAYGVAANVIGSLLETVGFWAVIFGVVVAFIKKSDLGVILGAGGAAVIEIIFFIITLATSGGYYFPMSLLINIIAFVLVAVFAYLKSDIKKRNDQIRVQQMNVFAQQHGMLGNCNQCGAPVMQGSAFCPNCGAKAPAPNPAQAYQPYQQPVQQAPQQDFYQAPAAQPYAEPFSPAQPADFGASVSAPADTFAAPVAAAAAPVADAFTAPVTPISSDSFAAPAAPAADAFAAPVTPATSVPNDTFSAEPAPAPAGKTCGNCATVNEPDSVFCMNCGSPL